jgi:hypothetical protein
MLYVDPAAGSIILQVAFAAILGGALTAKRWWGTLTRAVRTGVDRFRSR